MHRHKRKTQIIENKNQNKKLTQNKNQKYFVNQMKFKMKFREKPSHVVHTRVNISYIFYVQQTIYFRNTTN